MEAEINKMKVVELRDALAKRGLAKTGLKAELVERLAKAMQQEAARMEVENQPPSNIIVESTPPPKKESARLRKAPAGAAASEPSDVPSTPIQKVFAQARDEKIAPVTGSQPKAIPYSTFVDQAAFEAAIATVCQQVNPGMRLAAPAMTLMKNHLMYFVQRLMEARDSGIKFVSMSSLERAVELVLGRELAEHALSEAGRAVASFNESAEIAADSAAKTQAANLVFPVDLYHTLIVSVADVPPQNVEANAEVFLSACSEYICAELLELGGNRARGTLRDDIVAHDVTMGIADDDELRTLFSAYTCPVVGSDQQIAVANWKNEAQNLFRLLEQLPSEMVATAIKSVEQQLRVLDITLACSDALKAYAADMEANSPGGAEVRRLSGMVKILEASRDQVDCRQWPSGCVPSIKKTVFSLAGNGGVTLTFTYTNQIFDERQFEPWVEMRVDGFGAEGNGVLWTNNNGSFYKLDFDVLEAVRKAAASQLNDKDFVRFLLSIAECESGGGRGNADAELENMEHHEVFEVEASKPMVDL